MIPPRHPFEVRVSIGGDDWEYVRRALRELAAYVEERDPKDCGLSSGGGGGCHSIDVQIREVSIETFHKELEEWRKQQVQERQLEESKKGDERNEHSTAST